MPNLVRSLQKIFQSKEASATATSHAAQGKGQKSPLHWILPGSLAIGRLPRAGDGAFLKQANIDVVLSLCAPSEGLLPPDVTDQFQCVRLILPDESYAVKLQPVHVEKAVTLMRQHIQEGRVVYVHCLAGMERSPTVCIAYLCQYHNRELWEACDDVKQAHPSALPTERQIQVIRDFIHQA